MERYEIIIQDRRTKKPTNVSGEDPKKKRTNVSGEDEDDENEQDQIKERKAAGKLIAKTAINEARALIVPNIGAITRDSLFQQKIDSTLSMVDTAFAFAVHPAYGALNMATKTASRLIQYTIENQKEQTRLAVSLQRASYINRSRE